MYLLFITFISLKIIAKISLLSCDVIYRYKYLLSFIEIEKKNI